MASVQPLHDRVLAERLESEEKTAGGIIIPGTAQEKATKAKIIATGPGARDDSGKIIPMSVKVGDVVLFTKWGGTEIKVDGKDLLVLKESDIIGILTESSADKKAA